MKKLDQLKSEVYRLKGYKEKVYKDFRELKSKIKVRKENVKELDLCLSLFQFISENSNNKIISLFEHTVSVGLQDLFDESYSFKFEIKSRGNSSACDFLVKTSEFPGWSDIIMNHGKSVQDIISLILRIVLIKLMKDQRGIVILDEPLSGVEYERQKLAGEFIGEISHKFGIQIIVVTHSTELTSQCDKEITING